MAEQAKQGDTVKVHYTGRLTDGTVFDSSQNRDPLEFTLGERAVIPGFEQAVVGMTEGETTTAEIPMDMAYGPRREDMLINVDREQFPDEIDPEVGQQLQVRRDDGQTALVTIAAVEGDNVVLDGNHPLAGEDLTFDIQLVEIV